MTDPYYPTVDVQFLDEQVSKSVSVADDGIIKVGTTTAYILKGAQAIYKRTMLVRELQPGQACFEQATIVAIRFAFMSKLLDWLDQHRSWKGGGYIVPFN